MDSTDAHLLAALRHNGRASISELSAALGVSRATVRARIGRLAARGVILGFRAILPSDVEGLPVRGIMLVEIEGKVTDRVVTALNGIPEVQAIHTTNGRWDLIVELGTDTLAELDAVLRRIRLISGVSTSETNLLLATKRSSQALKQE